MAELYDQFVGYINGTLLGDVRSVDGNVEADDQDVMTIVKGWAGQTPSPRKTVVKFESHVGKSGFEVDVFDKFLKSEKVVCVVQALGSGKKLKSEGFIRAPGFSGSVGQSANIAWEFHGSPAKFE